MFFQYPKQIILKFYDYLILITLLPNGDVVEKGHPVALKSRIQVMQAALMRQLFPHPGGMHRAVYPAGLSWHGN